MGNFFGSSPDLVLIEFRDLVADNGIRCLIREKSHDFSIQARDKQEIIKTSGFAVGLYFVEITQTSFAYGQNNRYDSPILDAKLYESALEKIERAIFLRRAN